MNDRLMPRQNKTVQDARLRLLDARTGSLAGGATVEYVEELHKQVRAWLISIEARLEELGREQARLDEIEAEATTTATTKETTP